MDAVEYTRAKERMHAEPGPPIAARPAAIVLFPGEREPVLLAVTPKMAHGLRIGESRAGDSEETRVRGYLQGIRGGHGIWLVREDGSSRPAEPRDIADMAYSAGWQRVDGRPLMPEPKASPTQATEPEGVGRLTATEGVGCLLMERHGVAIDLDPVRLRRRHGWAPNTASTLLDLCLEEPPWAAAWRRIGVTLPSRKGHVIHNVQVWWEADLEGRDRAHVQCWPEAGDTFSAQEEAQLRAIIAVETAMRKAGP